MVVIVVVIVVVVVVAVFVNFVAVVVLGPGRGVFLVDRCHPATLQMVKI